MEGLLDVYTPCLLDTPEFTDFEDHAFFVDQSKDTDFKDIDIPVPSPSDMSVSSIESDRLLSEAASSVNFSPTHSLVSEEDDVDLLSFLVKANDIETVSSTDLSTLSSMPKATKGGKKMDTFAVGDSILERNRKNAIAAKENRQKKKKYVETLESENQKLSADNERLNTESSELKRKVSSLEEEVLYLKSVLAHQSTLSKLLKNIGKTDVNLTTSFNTKTTSEPRTKRRKMNNDSSTSTSGGVCLHVSQDNVSLELCSKCASMAKGSSHQ
ncbi:uncharacterized protein LOC144450144 [Glandiceps talaboti]